MARPVPISLTTRSYSRMKLPKTTTMIAAAAVMTLAVAASPSATERAAVAGAVPLLPHAGEQEHLVVHRQAEDDGEQHHRHPRLDRRRLHAGEVAEPAPLEQRHDDAVGGADRQQVHDHGLERHEQRPEHDHQQQERQREHGAEEVRQARREVVGEVDVDGDGAGDGDVDAGGLLDRRAARRRAGG